jgi:hypothetical protein
MTVALKEPTLIVRVEQWAQETSRPTEQVLETAVQTYLDKLEREAIHAETEAFWTMHDELLKEYRGQHLALYQGKVVDHDEDASYLAKRIRERFGWLPVLIAPVKPGSRRDLRWIGGRTGQVDATTCMAALIDQSEGWHLY